MSGENGAEVWAGQGPVHEIKYTGLDYAMAALAQGGWTTLDNSSVPLQALHDPDDRHRPSGYAPSSSAYHVPTSHSPPVPTIKVISYTPSCGSPGSRLSVHIKSTLDHSFLSMYRFAIMILDKCYDAPLKYVSQVGQDYRYVLSTQIPHLDKDMTFGPSPLQVAVNDAFGNNLEILDVGKFFLKAPSASKLSATRKTKKRKALEVSTELTEPAAKRMAAPVLLSPPNTLQQNFELPRHFQPLECPPSAGWNLHDNYDHFTYESLPPNLLFTRPSLGYGPIVPDQGFQPLVNSPPHSLSHSVSPKTISGAPHTPNDYLSESPTSALPFSASNSPLPEQPSLIRTTQLPSQQHNTGYSDVLSSTGLLPNNNCTLRVAGNLNTMMNSWSDDEKRTRRRLVEFERSQAGSVVTVTFKGIPLDARSNSNICVSCIWWQERKEAYITSVDTIRLLEHLVASRFNVQEKNRIRRNLEGFRPLTVAKGRPDSDDFFKIVMGFGEPKPRVIEKDIKVFPWRVLNHMLKKVIGKYSADYASAGSLASLAQPEMMTQPTDAPKSIGSCIQHSADFQSPNSIQATAGIEVPYSWDSSFAGVADGYTSGLALQPNQHHVNNDLFYNQYDNFHDYTTPRLHEDIYRNSISLTDPTQWETQRYLPGTLSATPSSNVVGYQADYLLDSCQHDPDGSQQSMRTSTLGTAKL